MVEEIMEERVEIIILASYLALELDFTILVAAILHQQSPPQDHG
jgi:hypothetical protein